jgi:thiol-disulfide isomerase/thioredoxin
MKGGGPLWAVLALSACAPEPAVPRARPLPELTLCGTDAQSHRIREDVRRARLTVFEFFSPRCAVQQAHDARVNQLAERYAGRVTVLAIDSEVGASLERDEAAARARGYRFPILIDPGGRLARALGARYSSYSVVVDSGGRVRYTGAIDSDRERLHAEATPYLANAVDALLKGAEPDPAETRSFGCYLRTW